MFLTLRSDKKTNVQILTLKEATMIGKHKLGKLKPKTSYSATQRKQPEKATITEVTDGNEATTRNEASKATATEHLAESTTIHHSTSKLATTPIIVGAAYRETYHTS